MWVHYTLGCKRINGKALAIAPHGLTRRVAKEAGHEG
jgi:hypothetical protein